MYLPFTLFRVTSKQYGCFSIWGCSQSWNFWLILFCHILFTSLTNYLNSLLIIWLTVVVFPRFVAYSVCISTLRRNIRFFINFSIFFFLINLGLTIVFSIIGMLIITDYLIFLCCYTYWPWEYTKNTSQPWLPFFTNVGFLNWYSTNLAKNTSLSNYYRIIIPFLTLI